MMEAIGSDPSILDGLIAGNVNPFKKPVEDYAKLFPQSVFRAAVSEYSNDFEAFGYSPDLACVKQ